MTEELKFSLRCNNDLSNEEFIELAVLADDSGFDQVWLSDDLFFRSATVMLTAAALRTKRVHLGTGILNPYTVHPSEMAMFARTLAEISNGRALLGIAAGADDFLSWVDLKRDRPLRAVREAMAGLRQLLDGDDHPAPEGWSPEARLRFGHDLEGTVDIYLGAMSPRMLQLAGETADGVLPLLFPPERYVEARAHVLKGAAAVGRDEESIDVAACVWASVSTDRDEAIGALARKIAYFGPSFASHVLDGVGLEAEDLMPARTAIVAGDAEGAIRALPSAAMRLGVAGNVDDVIDRIGGLLDAGATHISFGPPLGPDPRVALELLCNEVVGALRNGSAG